MKKKLPALLCALALILSLAGCVISTPDTVGTIGDVEITSGLYLLAQYSAYQQAAQLAGKDQDATDVKAFLKENGIVPQAWYPLGHGDKALLQEPLFAQLGKKYGKSAPQIILRWHIQSGNIVIPGSKNPDHIKSNFDLFDFALTDDEMAQITALNKNVRYYTSTPEMLKKYAEMVPPVDEQK